MGNDFGKILVTGSYGQIGSELTPKLRELYGKENIIASGRKVPTYDSGPFEILDVNDAKRLEEVIIEHDIDLIIHLAALLSTVFAGG